MLAQLKSYSGKLNEGLEGGKKVVESGRKAAKNGFDNLYSVAMNNPRTAAAVVLGTGVAAALIWAVRRNGGYSAVRKQVLAKVRSKPQPRARRSSRARATA